MTFTHNGQIYPSDNDLDINVLGFWPKVDIPDEKLKQTLRKSLGYDFLGGDIIVAYLQRAVSSAVSFDQGLIDEIEKDISSDKDPSEIIFEKTSTGIGRGHSLGGLSGLVLGLNGTKMIDSALTGIVSSRSLVTSGRRRDTKEEEIVIPQAFLERPDLLNEFLKISKDVFSVSSQIKDKFKKSRATETFNKILPYNNPANLVIVLPLDSVATLHFETLADKRFGMDGKYVPKEVHTLVDAMPELMNQAGLGIMYEQRIKVPRDTYLHYTVFKDPDYPNYSLELAEANGFSLDPRVIDFQKDFTDGFYKALERTKKILEETRKTKDKKELVNMAMQSMLALGEFTREYNESLRLKVADTISWRVWSEQKRHATLRQEVESVYTAADRSYEIVKGIWSSIEEAYNNQFQGDITGIVTEAEKAFSIFKDIKENRELLLPYMYHTARQIMFYHRLVEEGFEKRDAIFIVPRNIMVRTVENYDLTNLVDLEFPLRLCSACEAERYETSWKKQGVISQTVPELGYLLGPKCWSVGMCTEPVPCKHIYDIRDYPGKEEHQEINRMMLKK